MAQQEAKREERLPARRRADVVPFGGWPSRWERMMEELFPDWPGMQVSPFPWRMGEFMPSVEVIDERDRIVITAELPGIDAADMEVTITDEEVTIEGEKKTESARPQGAGMTYGERSFGSFRRSIRVNAEIDRERAEATFRNGVLTVILPRTHEGLRKARKIEISHAQEEVTERGVQGQKATPATGEAHAEEIEAHLASLLDVDEGAGLTYAKAIDNIESPEVKGNLESFRKDHERHAREWAGMMKRTEQAPGEPMRSLRAAYHEIVAAIRAELGERSALAACEAGEKHANDTYRGILSRVLPADLKTRVERNYAEEQRHLAYIQKILAEYK